MSMALVVKNTAQEEDAARVKVSVEDCSERVPGNDIEDIIADSYDLPKVATFCK
jgi:hypothetical protein